MNAKKTWLVTGASKGLGLALVRELLDQGYNVAATSRSVDELRRQVSERASFLPLTAELVDERSVAAAVAAAQEAFGRIDVVVNNAGYGQLGTLEELNDAEARRNFDVNVFGSLNVIRHVMPHLRARRAGHVFNISSIGGFTGAFPGWGVYCATKFAVAGLTEALSAEAKAFGITSTVVYPGYFRTEFLSGGSLRLPAQPLAEYADARALEAMHVEQIAGNQPGDPVKAARVLIKVAETQLKPLHLFLGRDAHDMATARLESLRDELASTEVLATATSF